VLPVVDRTHEERDIRLMKSALIMPLLLLVAGCASQHSYYTSERSHVQRDQIIAESNRFPTAGNRDTYYWYQKNSSRNMSGPTGTGSEGYYGPQAPANYGSPWPGYYAPRY
jgi:hypothetical protein